MSRRRKGGNMLEGSNSSKLGLRPPGVESSFHVETICTELTIAPPLYSLAIVIRLMKHGSDHAMIYTSAVIVVHWSARDVSLVSPILFMQTRR